jgi:undecaprenyl-diphosphatase
MSGPERHLHRLDRKAIAPPAVRRARAAAFQTYVLISSAGFVALAVVAHGVAYFPIDLKITRAVQAYHGAGFDRLMYMVSWVGYFPQCIPLTACAVLFLVGLGLRWEAIAALFALLSSPAGMLVKLIVMRPRPAQSLVHVIGELHSTGFPSGHVLVMTTFGGYLTFLGFTLPRRSPGRSIVLTGELLLIALMGLSRIYEGAHWFSDVMGAYLLGGLWLALTIRLYRWGKPKFFVHQPVAPARHSPADAGAV